MESLALARNAMATRFEFLLHGSNPVSLRAAGEEALDEVVRIEGRLSLYKATSEIARVNALASRGKVRVSATTFRLLQHARLLHEQTGGVFDITIAPLVKCWGFMGGQGRLPSDAEIEEALARVGMTHVELDESDFSVRFLREGMMIDLGAIGKGFALESAAESLRENGVESAFLHGGTSTVHCIGKPMDAEVWKVALDYPKSPGAVSEATKVTTPLAVVRLKDEGLSVSGVWGRAIQHEGKILGHVLDPRTGRPVMGAMMSCVVLPSATETDALSTALLVAGASSHEAIHALRPGMRSLVLGSGEKTEPKGDAAAWQISSNGIEITPV